MTGKRKRADAAKKGWGTRRAEPEAGIRPKKLKQWLDESMNGALEAVKGGLMGVNQVSRNFGVPRTTLRDRISGRVEHGAKSGPTPYLTEKEDQELASFLRQASRIGYGKTKKEVLAIVQKRVEKKGHPMKKFNGEGWWQRFMSRHERLSLRTADPLSKARADALTQSKVDEYFKLLTRTLEEHGLTDKPFHVYNEREKKAAEREELKRQKAKQKEQRLMRKTRKSKAAAAKASGETSIEGIHCREISSNECAVCFGAYDDDLADGKPLRDWIQCTYPDCSKWMHEECLEKDSNHCMICPLCHTLFK